MLISFHSGMYMLEAMVLDIPDITALQQKYHVTTISDADQPHSFVTTLFIEDQFK